MQRKDFIKSIGLIGLTGSISGKSIAASSGAFKYLGQTPPNCTLIPSETAGPFPLDLTENPTFFRQDIREGKTGVQLNLKLKIVGSANCLPMSNLRVNIWHCDKDGLYSGYNQQNNQGQQGLTYLRGYQLTDSNGEVNFTTIFPGWYSGRICHIHFQVFVSSMYAAISQLTFPVSEKNAIYGNNSSIYTKGADPLTFNSDNIFSDGYAFQLASLTQNASTGVYESYLEVTINGSGTSALQHLEPETGGQFKLGQNFPNPYSGHTIIPFSLTNPSEVRIALFDLDGRKVAETPTQTYSAGAQEIPIDTKSMGLPHGNLIYEIQVSNSIGIFRQCKMMTVSKSE